MMFGHTAAIPNPEPWTDVLPRVLCTLYQGDRVVLDEEGVHVERRRKDRLGQFTWVEDRNWCDIVNNINLDADDWLEKFDAAGFTGAFVDDGGEGVSLYVSQDGKRFITGRNYNGVFRRMSVTGWFEQFRVTGPANAWVLLESKESVERAAEIKGSLIFRLIGGDPSVRLTPVQAAEESADDGYAALYEAVMAHDETVGDIVPRNAVESVRNRVIRAAQAIVYARGKP